MGDQGLVGCGFVYSCCIWILILVTGIMSVKHFRNHDPYTNSGLSQLAGMYEMARDWEREPIVELMVTEETSCPEGWRSIYERIFYGLDVGCDCLRISHQYITGDNTFMTGQQCDYNQTLYGCGMSTPFPPRYMHRIDDRLVCGKTGGQPYSKA